MRITIFATGGTFDKEYNEITGELYFKNTHIREILDLGRSLLDIDIKKLMLIDSLKMTNKDRKEIAQNCVDSKSRHIVITHGTDTMRKTAEVISKKNLDKTIVFTGAMIPYKFGSSDGLFNLGCALAFVQSLPIGVYIAMNGKYFRWNEVKKTSILGNLKKYDLRQLTFLSLTLRKSSLKKKIALKIITSYVYNVLLGGLGHKYSY